jgi:hypothetical protein
MRFLGRKVYAGLIVVFGSAMMNGLNPERVRRIREVLKISTSTLKRWRKWWLDSFVRSSFWKAMRATETGNTSPRIYVQQTEARHEPTAEGALLRAANL